MTITELINVLEKTKKKHGDKEIVIAQVESHDDISDFKLRTVPIGGMIYNSEIDILFLTGADSEKTMEKLKACLKDENTETYTINKDNGVIN